MTLNRILILIALTTANLALADTNSARNAYFSEQYRLLCELSAKPWQSANSADDAAQMSLSVAEPLAISLRLNTQGLAYLNLSVEEWDEKLIFFHSKGIELLVEEADITGADISNLECLSADMSITHINTHEWGSYVVEIHGKPHQEIILKLTREENK